MPRLICLRLLKQVVRCPRALAFDKAGSSNAARMAMMAMTTSISMSVKPRRQVVAPARFMASFYLFHHDEFDAFVTGLKFQTKLIEDRLLQSFGSRIPFQVKIK